MAKKGSFLSQETKDKISKSASERLRYNGKFISREKQETIIELAKTNGLKEKDAQTFLNQNETLVEGYILRGEIDATFSSKNYVKYLGNNFNKFYVNGEKVSRTQAIYLIAQTQNYLARELGSNVNLFNGKMTDITKNGAQTLMINLPMKRTKTNSKKWRVDMEMIEDMDGDDIEVLYRTKE